jgi:hypothetical protein
MARRKRIDIVSVIFLVLGLIGAFFCAQNSSDIHNQNQLPLAKYSHLKEADYVNMYCKGIIEYRLPDRTRVDCLTDEYAIEFDYAKKWAESIGQSLYYSKMTGKAPAVVLILTSLNDYHYVKRVERLDNGIKIFLIKAF